MLLETQFDTSARSTVSASVGWGQLPSPPPPLDVLATGTGEVSVVAALDFIPRDRLLFPTYRYDTTRPTCLRVAPPLPPPPSITHHHTITHKTPN